MVPRRFVTPSTDDLLQTKEQDRQRLLVLRPAYGHGAVPRPSARLVLASVFLGVLAGCFGRLFDLGGGMPQELLDRGVSAPAAILEIWDTGWTINDSPVIGMKVRVMSADRAAFEATIEKTTISRLAVPQFQPGRVVPVRFDPANQAVVAVDFDAPAPSQPSSSGSPAGACVSPP